MSDTTLNKLLNGKLEIEQPSEGYRIAVDTLLLASAVPMQNGQRGLDLGCGVGGVMLAVAARLESAFIDGLEIQPIMVDLCAANIKLNGFDTRLTVMQGDVATLPDEKRGLYDHVMINPPYHEESKHSVSDNKSKRLANSENDQADLGVWIGAAHEALKGRGTLSLIHRYDRLDDIIALARPLFKVIVIKPICARQSALPKRVIVRCIKGDQEENLRTASSFLLHEEDCNRYTPSADAILRDAGEMAFDLERL